MMMKSSRRCKWIYVLAALCILTGCTGEVPAPSESSTPYVTPATSETSADTSGTTEETALQLPAATYTDDLPVIHIERNDPEKLEETITVEGDGFGALRDTIDEIQEANLEQYHVLLDPDSEWSGSNRYYPERIDSELVSFYYMSHYTLSDATYEGYTISCDGDIVFFEDLIIPGQMQAFTEAAEDFIDDEYRWSLDGQFYTSLDIDDVYAQFEDLDNSGWFLDASSIVFIYRYQLGDSQKDRACAIHLPYDEFSEYINPRFLPGDQAMIGTYSYFDLYYSEDYMMETIPDSHDGLRDYIVARDLTRLFVNNRSYNFDNSYLSERGVCTYVRDAEGNSYLVIVQGPTYEPVEGMEYVKIYDITNGELELVYSSDEGYERQYYSDIDEVLALIEQE